MIAAYVEGVPYTASVACPNGLTLYVNAPPVDSFRLDPNHSAWLLGVPETAVLIVAASLLS